MTKLRGTLKEQLKLEAEYKTIAETMLKSAYEKARTNTRGSETAIGSKLLQNAYETCANNIHALLFPAQQKRGVVPVYSKAIAQLKQIYEDEQFLTKTCTVITISNMINFALYSTKEASLTTLTENIVLVLCTEAQAYAYTKQADKHNKAYFDIGLNKRVGEYYKEQFANKAYKIQHYTPPKFDIDAMYKLSTKMIEMCIVGSGYFEIEYKDYVNKKGQTSRIKALKANTWLIETWTKNIELLALNKSRFCPCVIPPKRWTSIKEGAYYGDNAKYVQLVRVRINQTNIFVQNYMKRLEQIDLSYLFTVLNSLQETPFIINENILNVCLDIMSNHGSLGGLPSTDDLPELPRLINPTPEELKKHKVKLTAMYKKDRARQSKLLRTNCTLAVAKKYSQYEKVYFPWNMDYRGRLYPMPTEINPQGDDLQKALLLFAGPEPLTDNECLKWFYIAGAGFAGLDKKPFQERINWILEHENQIISSAKSPLEFTWWDEVAGDESPLCFLSFCFEFKRLREYQADHDGSAIGFKTGLHISFDGTCSGLQHFSMLLADEIGGKAVNLVPDETVHDIYQVVADKVNVVLKKDVVSGTEDTYKLDKKTGEVLTDSEGNKKIQYGTKELATQWMMYGKEKFGTEGIKRKVCKRSVMTLAYGSGRYGFAENLKSDIIKPWQDEHEDNPIFLDKAQAATYMAGLIWDAVSTTVVKAVEGMKWLQSIAQQIGKNGEAVAWVTPNGLPIQQNKFVMKTEIFKLRFLGSIMRFYRQTETGDIDVRAQAQAIAPNFIHSLDACHMQKVIMNQHNKGNKNFFMIHDSFGTDLYHANDLFTSIRSELVNMYEGKNLLEEWLKDIEYLLPEKTKIKPIPTKGTLDIKQIRESKYCFA